MEKKIHGILKNHGVNNNYKTNERHQDDYYSTPPEAVEQLLKYEKFNKNIFEPMVGQGAIAQTLTQHGHTVQAMDIHDRGYPNTIIQDYLQYNKTFHGDIITNPPYKNSYKYVLHAITHCTGKIAMLLKIQFLETITRYEELFKKHPPHKIYCFVKRIACYPGGEYEKYKNKGSSMCFCWIIWDNQKTTPHDTIFKWIPNHISTTQNTHQTRIENYTQQEKKK